MPKELCRYSADVNYAASQPLGSFKLRTALHMAAAGQCADIVRLLPLDPALGDPFRDPKYQFRLSLSHDGSMYAVLLYIYIYGAPWIYHQD